MKKGLKTNPSVARIADRIAAATTATEARGKCSRPSVRIVESRLKFPSSRWKEDPYIAWNAFKDKNRLLFN